MPKKQKTVWAKRARPAKAVIPAAGLGMRFRPLSAVVPKELLPVDRKPLIQWALEEAIASGIWNIGIVIRRGKEVIREYIEGIKGSVDTFQNLPERDLPHPEIHFIYQEEPLGLGNAIYEAGDFIEDSPFVMIIPDQFVISNMPATKQLLDSARRDRHSVWNSVVRIAKNELPLFPGARGFKLGEGKTGPWEVLGIEETPPRDGGQTTVGFGRTYFPEGVIRFFSERYVNPETGEVDLLPTFHAMMQEKRSYAALLEGRPMDFGTWSGYDYFSQILNSFSPSTLDQTETTLHE